MSTINNNLFREFLSQLSQNPDAASIWNSRWETSDDASAPLRATTT